MDNKYAKFDVFLMNGSRTFSHGDIMVDGKRFPAREIKINIDPNEETITFKVAMRYVTLHLDDQPLKVKKQFKLPEIDPSKLIRFYKAPMDILDEGPDYLVMVLGNRLAYHLCLKPFHLLIERGGEQNPYEMEILYDSRSENG